jgi:hypothetical protein
MITVEEIVHITGLMITILILGGYLIYRYFKKRKKGK